MDVSGSDPATWGLTDESDQFQIGDSISGGGGLWQSDNGFETTESVSETASLSVTHGYSLEDDGGYSLSGSSSDSSDSYTVTDWLNTVSDDAGAASGTLGRDGGAFVGENDYSLEAGGTDSFGPAGQRATTESFGTMTLTDLWGTGSYSAAEGTGTDSEGDEFTSQSSGLSEWGSATVDDGEGTLSTSESFFPPLYELTGSGGVYGHAEIFGPPIAETEAYPFGLLYEIGNSQDTTDEIGISFHPYDFSLYDLEGETSLIPRAVSVDLMGWPPSGNFGVGIGTLRQPGRPSD